MKIIKTELVCPVVDEHMLNIIVGPGRKRSNGMESRMTDFNQFIDTWIFPILQKYAFDIKEQCEYYVCFESNTAVVVIAHDVRSRENSLQLGIPNDFAYQLTDQAIKEIFQSDIGVDLLPMDIFLENVRKFLANFGGTIFDKDLRLLKKFKAFIGEQSRLYYLEMTTRTYLEDADKAWAKQDYNTFIDIYKKIDKSALKKSYNMKYKIALKRKS